ncbi:MAG: eukaryotic-like serine/threonine-protein kinase [Thermoplasmata archaeon]|nr:eukaryotic-like serine/threonine-protein kinase [Thermoplasmata archaeon]
MGVLILAARPGAPAHKVLGALLLLRAGFMGAFALATSASGPGDALALSFVGAAWSLAIPALVVYAARTLWPSRAPRATGWLLVVLVAAAALLGVASAADPAMLVASVQRVPGGWGAASGPLLYVNAALSAAADAAFVLVAARATRDPEASEPARRAAGLLGLAFGVFTLYSAGFFAASALTQPGRLAAPLFALRATATMAAGLAILTQAPRLASPARAWGPPVAACALAVAGLGALDDLLGDRGADALLRALFGALVIVAVVRYGLASADPRERARARSGLRILLAGASAAAVGLLVQAGLGAGALAWGAAGSAALLAFALAWRPMDLLAARILLATDDPRAVAERARRYAAAFAIAGETPALEELRRSLGITLHEHQLLVQGRASREAIGRYALGPELHRGSTASVHLATDAQTGREVVVKRFHAAREGQRILAEARALQAAASPRVVRLLDVGHEDGRAFLVMERAAGGSARDALDRAGPFPPERAVALVEDLLEALDAMHAAGLVHGDVKCENLLLDADGRGLLADLGSARASDPTSTLTSADAEGSLATLAPEVARGQRPTPAADLYAAGAVLYRLLTGEHPIDLAGLDALSARDRLLIAPPRLPHERVPAWLAPILRSALAKRPEERPASAAAFRGLLRTGRPGASAPRPRYHPAGAAPTSRDRPA